MPKKDSDKKFRELFTHFGVLGEQEMVVKTGKPGSWYFFDETWNLKGPYKNWVQATWNMHRYAEWLDKGTSPPTYDDVKIVLHAFLGITEEEAE